LKPEQIIEQIKAAGSWLPLTTLRQAFNQCEALTPPLLEAVRLRAEAESPLDIPLQRLAAFGVFFLAQHREPRLLESLVRLFETSNPALEDEWLFSGRLFFFGHRLLAGVCRLDAQIPMQMALDAKLTNATRSIAVCAIGMMAAYGDCTRAEAVKRHRQLFPPTQALKCEFMDGCWVRAAAKLDAQALERELKWFMASGRLDSHCRSVIAGAMGVPPELSFASIVALEPLVDMFLSVFPQDMRRGEIGYLPNGQIPNLDLFAEDAPGRHAF
jgi:hypothetical protein